MIEHVVLCDLQHGHAAGTLDYLLRETRLRLLKLPVVVAVRCGKRFDGEVVDGFFFAVSVETEAKLRALLADPAFRRLESEVLDPVTTARRAVSFQTDPGGDPLYF